MPSDAERIKLTPALPWVDRGGALAGLVTEIGADRLFLTVGGQAALTGTVAITVQCSADLAFAFEGVAGPMVERTQTLTVTSEAARHALRDLLGQLRKDQHIEICRSMDVETSDRFTGFSRLSFVPSALPELDFVDLDTSVSFLGYKAAAPLLITGMTGGIEKGAEINRRLALAAAKHRIPMGIGSQRIALDNAAYAPIFDVKRHAPELFLIGNLGCAQLAASDAIDVCQRAVAMIGADALAIHLNVVQECVQVEGDREFKGLLARIARLTRALSVPVIIKEVGSGLSPDTALRLADAGVAAIDVGGSGGTSWGYIEGLRSSSPETMALAEAFRDWGVPTAYSLAALRQALPGMPLVATGGIRDGHTVAKAVAIGGTLVGIGLPLLRAALEDEDGPSAVIATLIRGLKTAMVATGSPSLHDLERHICLGRPLEREFEAHLQAIQSGRS